MGAVSEHPAIYGRRLADHTPNQVSDELQRSHGFEGARDAESTRLGWRYAYTYKMYDQTDKRTNQPHTKRVLNLSTAAGLTLR